MALPPVLAVEMRARGTEFLGSSTRSSSGRGSSSAPTGAGTMMSGSAPGPKTATQRLREEIRDLERCEMPAAIELVPVEELGIDRRSPATGCRQIMRKDADAHG